MKSKRPQLIKKKRKKRKKLESDLKERAQKGPREPLPVADKSSLQLGTGTTIDPALEPHEIGYGIALQELFRRPIFMRRGNGRRRGSEGSIGKVCSGEHKKRGSVGGMEEEWSDSGGRGRSGRRI